MTQKIVGVFTTEQDATNAIQDLKNLGYRAEDISVIGKNKDDLNDIHEETGTKAPEGMATGAATGGVLGGIAGLLAGLGALAIPGIGPILAAGPIAATLTGAAVGAGTGGLVGGLVGLGIPEDEAEEYNANVKSGRILVMVDANEIQKNEVYSLFRDHHSMNSSHYPMGTGTLNREEADIRKSETREPVFYQELATMDRPQDTITDGTSQDRTMRLREEQLDISKTRQTTGEVNLRKEVIEQEQSINVPVTREEVVIEKKAVQDEATGEPIGKDETIRIPVTEERVEVSKRPVVTGEVEIHKRQVQDTEHVSDTLKKEEARLEQTGNPTVKGDEDLK
ncbi:YsnF/AvaK domain-containing protein [Paenibacillus pinistramenti]|uniref:YsnF/AvaK domain-containing protein n=1 Tax=Paenibacillus pinistramenti TaxID=1768003 RepID=UPI001108ABDB|nr:YsnF/AvaK domain-containing protein [Paenibacillus pinistramenti]